LRRVQRSQEALDAAVNGFVGDVDLDVKLPNAGVQPDVRVESENHFLSATEEYSKIVPV
jgi:hypothetical protein